MNDLDLPDIDLDEMREMLDPKHRYPRAAFLKFRPCDVSPRQRAAASFIIGFERDHV